MLRYSHNQFHKCSKSNKDNQGHAMLKLYQTHFISHLSTLYFPKTFPGKQQLQRYLAIPCHSWLNTCSGPLWSYTHNGTLQCMASLTNTAIFSAITLIRLSNLSECISRDGHVWQRNSYCHVSNIKALCVLITPFEANVNSLKVILSCFVLFINVHLIVQKKRLFC